MAAPAELSTRTHTAQSGGGGGSSSSNPRGETGFYCSTSGTYFSDKESLAEHYKSDFHRYNLKRKVAGLPPVTKEWFEARKAQLTSAAAAPHTKVWYDPLTKKKFMTQQTYQAHVNSKKYQQLVRDSGEPAPAPIIMVRQQQQEPQEQQPQQQPQQEGAASSSATTNGATTGPKQGPTGFTVKAPARTSAAAAAANGTHAASDEEEEAGSDWETASEVSEEGDEAGEYEEWDPCVSLFDNKVSPSMEANLRYMYKHFGFFLPDAEFLDDPEGLIKYLGAKLAIGKVPLYTAGDDPNAKQFRSLHAVQRHMVDTNQCRLLFDGNEEEYEDFYDYSSANNSSSAGQQEGADGAVGADGAAEGADSSSSSKQLALAFDGLSLGSSGAAGGWELAIPAQSSGSGGGGTKILGSRELARYYKQRPKPLDTRKSVIVNTIIAQYRSLGLATQTSTPPAVQRAAQRQEQNMKKRTGQLLFSRNNVNFNLPKNVTY